MKAMPMREEIEELFKITFQQDVFVVGGGSSLTDFDFELLKDKVTVAINTAFLKLPNASVLYWCDEPWAARHYDSLVRHPCKLRFMAKFGVSDASLSHKGIAGSAYLKRTGIFGLADDRDSVHGNNSGAHVLNLLANMKPKRILLLGFDMGLINRKSHWHDLHETPSVSKLVYEDGFIPCIKSMAAPIAERGIEVINCSIESRLLCFPKRVVYDYL